MAIFAAAAEYCDVCRSNTKRCEYYPAGRSRRHGKCLECDHKDPRSPVGFKSKDVRYCRECDTSNNAPRPGM
jgi:hypothetical protein